MLDLLNWASNNPVIFFIIFFSILALIVVIITRILKVLLKKQLEISSRGIKVLDAKGGLIGNAGKVSVNDIKDCVKFIEEKQCELVDDIHGIKDRFFRQSKDYAKSRIIASKNNIIEMYKIAYANVYFKGSIETPSKEEIVARIGEISKEEVEQRRKGIDGMESCTCKIKCKSGLTYFEAKMTQDFKPILEKVYEIIEKNHLINKDDLEFDEEIRAKAIDLSTTLRNQVMSYETPVDCEIAKIVMDRQMGDLQLAIIDGLRNSRILSKKKREIIKKVKANYESRKTEKLKQIFDKIGASNLENVLEGVNNIKDHEGYDQDL